MKFTKIMTAAALIVCTHFAHGSGTASDYQLSTIECTQVGADHIHLACKMSDASELSGSLVNYDVKNSDGKIIASGFGTDVLLDNNKLASNEEYSVVVYAIVNGNAVSQSVSRRAPVK